MLFEGSAVQARKDAWKYHPFDAANNINGADVNADHDGRGVDFYTLQPTAMGTQVLRFREAHVRKVVERKRFFS